jgi:hypothetical protein
MIKVKKYTEFINEEFSNDKDYYEIITPENYYEMVKGTVAIKADLSIRKGIILFDKEITQCEKKDITNKNSYIYHTFGWKLIDYIERLNIPEINIDFSQPIELYKNGEAFSDTICGHTSKYIAGLVCLLVDGETYETWNDKLILSTPNHPMRGHVYGKRFGL